MTVNLAKGYYCCKNSQHVLDLDMQFKSGYFDARTREHQYHLIEKHTWQRCLAAYWALPDFISAGPCKPVRLIRLNFDALIAELQALMW
jgi:hypothetical protein